MTLNPEDLAIVSFPTTGVSESISTGGGYCCTGCASGCGINPTASGCASGGDTTIMVAAEPVAY
jgi:hypothetical protein